MVPANSCITGAWREANPFRRSSGRENYLRFLNSNVEYSFERGNLFRAEAFAKAVSSAKEIDYVAANCQLLITPLDESGEICRNPDVQVPWSDVLVVRCYQTEESVCPICLDAPVLPRMGPCGHVYCYLCVSCYIAFENDTSCKQCAVCGVQLRTNDLRRVRIFPSRVPKVDDMVRLELMRRHKRSIFPTVASEMRGDWRSGGREANVATRFLSRLAVAKREDINELVDGDIVTMEAILAEGQLEEVDEQRFLIAKRILRKLKAEKKVMEDVMIFTSDEASSVPEDATAEDYFFYYQEVSGHDVYLHSMNWRCLVEDFGVSNLPQEIRGKVVEVETYTMSSTLRSRYRHLRHLPLGRTFRLIEIEFESPIISAKTLLLVSDILAMRQRRREQKEARERSLTRAKEEAEDLVLSVHEDFVPLDVAMAEVLSSSRCHSSPVLPSLLPSFISSAGPSSGAVVANGVCADGMESPEKVKTTSSWLDVASRGQGVGSGTITAAAATTSGATAAANCSVWSSSQASSCTADSSVFGHDSSSAVPANAQEGVPVLRSRRKKGRAKHTE
ncbi:RING finger protein 10 [Echinococcus multilocularis]|uniref:E3 ubiquitin-protein ligase RNF10 n=1 Tax=Echinococcus multilocularis TaxID=6211 RepID=U6HVC5_ECHMU|nr:RING finger protein 10 [Echinococcus multilocularis]CDS39849.1 RING finger protein 10 [Echinococcus multilocularis]